MITIPRRAQGTKVNLPSRPINQNQKEPLIVTVDAENVFHLNVGEVTESGVNPDTLIQRVTVLLVPSMVNCRTVVIC